MVNHLVRRYSGVVSLLSNILGALAGIRQIVAIAVRVYFEALQWNRSKKSRGVDLIEHRKSEGMELVVLTLDADETGNWKAQSAWNRSFRSSVDSRLNLHETRHEQSEAAIALLKVEVEQLRRGVHT